MRQARTLGYVFNHMAEMHKVVDQLAGEAAAKVELQGAATTKVLGLEKEGHPGPGQRHGRGPGLHGGTGAPAQYRQGEGVYGEAPSTRP